MTKIDVLMDLKMSIQAVLLMHTPPTTILSAQYKLFWADVLTIR